MQWLERQTGSPLPPQPRWRQMATKQTTRPQTLLLLTSAATMTIAATAHRRLRLYRDRFRSRSNHHHYHRLRMHLQQQQQQQYNSKSSRRSRANLQPQLQPQQRTMMRLRPSRREPNAKPGRAQQHAAHRPRAQRTQRVPRPSAELRRRHLLPPRRLGALPPHQTTTTPMLHTRL